MCYLKIKLSTHLLLDAGLIDKSAKHIVIIIRYFLDFYNVNILKRN